MNSGEKSLGKVTTMSKTKEVIRNYVVTNFLFGESDGLEDDTSLLEQKIIDSTGILEMVAFLEKEFSVSIDDEELVPENLDSINNMYTYLTTKKAKNLDHYSQGSWVSI